MRSTSVKPIAVLAIAVLLSINAFSQTRVQKDQSDRKPLADSLFFNALVTQYVESVNKADTVLGRKIWAPTAEISFIHPGGTEYGWEGVRTIYKLFSDNFSLRKLSFSSLKFAYYGDVSWVTFYWTFDANLKTDNRPVQDKGRETQIWRKINNEWRLVHVHYSGMPVTAQGQGF